MAETKGTIGILTGGGDVPGLNPAIRAITIRALREGYRVLGIRRGWAGLVDMVPEKDANNSGCYTVLTEEVVNRAGRTGGLTAWMILDRRAVYCLGGRRQGPDAGAYHGTCSCYRCSGLHRVSRQ